MAILMIIWRLPDFVTSFLAAVMSGWMVVWMEFIESTSLLIPGLILAILSWKLGKNLKYKFNYGTGKVEAITALCCEVFDIAGLLCILFLSIRELIRPEAEGREMLQALGLSVVGLLIDIYILWREKKILEHGYSRMLHTAYLSSKKELGFDIISVISLVIGIVFKDKWWIVYFSPTVCIVIAIPFVFFVAQHMRDSIIELTDLTLDEDSQLKILKVMSEFYDSYEEMGDIKSRINGEDRHIDIELKFRADLSYSQVSEVADNISERIKDVLGESDTNIVIR